MAKFEMEITVDRHSHSETAYRHSIATALDQVKMEIGRGVAEEGDVTVPPHTVIGWWKISGR